VSKAARPCSFADSYTRKEYLAMVYGHDDVTSGCSSDLMRATDVASRMIKVGGEGDTRSRQHYGFSDKVGLVAHGDDESVYLSGKKKDEIESEIRS
jgi:ATP-dependent metalloprotease